MSKTANVARSRKALAYRQARRLARSVEVVTLFYALYGLSTSVADWYIGNERDDWETNDWSPNMQWNSVRIHRCDVPTYLRAMNQYLYGCWTPNQGFGHGKCDYDGSDDIRNGREIMMDLVTF